jgi:hypothetical protein
MKKKKEKTLELWLKDTQKKIHKKIVSTRFMALRFFDSCQCQQDPHLLETLSLLHQHCIAKACVGVYVDVCASSSTIWDIGAGGKEGDRLTVFIYVCTSSMRARPSHILARVSLLLTTVSAFILRYTESETSAMKNTHRMKSLVCQCSNQTDEDDDDDDDVAADSLLWIAAAAAAEEEGLAAA